MIPSRLPRPPRAGLLLLVTLLVLLAGCGGKTPAQLALDELNAGLAASNQGDSEGAAAHYVACLKHDSLNEFCIYNLGVIAHTAGRLLEAENDYRLALLIDPNFGRALFNLAILRADQGGTDEAIALYRHAIEVEPENAGAHLNLGLLLRATGQVAEGEAELAAAKALDPTIVVPTFEPEATPSPTPRGSPSESPSPSATPK